MKEEIGFEELAPWLAILITLIGGFLRVFLLGSKGMWLDETFSVWLANHSASEMLQWIVKVDQHPPLYYLLLHGWIALNGDTAYDVRLLSALFGAGTIPVIYLIGRRLSGSLVGLASAAFLALSPFHVYFAQETRMYTLLTFNAAVAILALVRLLTDPRSAVPIGSQFREYLRAWRTPGPVRPDTARDFSYDEEAPSQTGWRAWIVRHRWLPLQTVETDLAWIAFIVFSAASLLSHNTAVFLIVATNLFVLGLMLSRRVCKSRSQTAFQAPSLGNWMKAQIGLFLLWSPWAVAFVRQAGRVAQEFWLPRPTWEIVTGTLRALLNPSAPGQASQVILTWILCAVLCLGLVQCRKRLSIFLFLASLFAVPVLGELVVSIRRPIFIDRTLIWITIPLYLVLAAGIAQLRYRVLMIAVLGVLATNYLLSDGDYYRFVRKEDWSTAAGYVANFAERDDLVLFNSAFVQIPFDYYFRTYEDLYSIRVEKRGVPADMLEGGILEPKMAEGDVPKLIALLRGRSRVWLVYSHDSYTDPLGLVPQTIASVMKLIRTREFYGGRVQLYVAP